MTYVDRHKTPRKWPIQTAYTRSIGVRLPNDEYERLKDFCSAHGYTTTELVRDALRDFMDNFEEGGQGLFV